MFTLKLYQNHISSGERTVVMECAGIWVDRCPKGTKHVRAFPKTVGIADEDMKEFYVGGDHSPKWQNDEGGPTGAPPSAITPDNYYSWGVLENAQGKTTEMLR